MTHTYKPIFFSAAHSEAFERARRQQEQSHERAQEILLWKRGFHIDGGRPSWGYYLEVSTSTSTTANTTDGGGESTEDEREEREEDEREGRRESGKAGAGKRTRGNSPDRHATGRASLIASHGALLRLSNSWSLSRAYSHSSSNTSARCAIATHDNGLQDARLDIALVRSSPCSTHWSNGADRSTPPSTRFALTIPVIFWDAGYCFFRYASSDRSRENYLGIDRLLYLLAENLAALGLWSVGTCTGYGNPTPSTRKSTMFVPCS